MKKFKQLLESLPAKSSVITFGRFNPPTVGHDLVIRLVKKLAESNRADSRIYVQNVHNKKNPLTEERKHHYLNFAFPHQQFVSTEKTCLQVVTEQSQKYKTVFLVTSKDSLNEFKELPPNVKVIVAGDINPDFDERARNAAYKGDFNQFKKTVILNLREIDAKVLMNDIRTGMGLDPIRDQIKFEVDTLRERYFNKEIFNVGDLVESAGNQYEILSRGSNYITVVDSTGTTFRKWIQECIPVEKIQEDIQPGPAPEEITFKGYTTKNLHHSADAAKAFQSTIEKFNNGIIHDPVALLNALKATDTYMKLNDMHLEQDKAPDDKELALWRDAHTKARESLERIGEFPHHMDYWHMHEHELQDMETKYNPATAGSEMSDSFKPQGELVEAKQDGQDTNPVVDKTSKRNAAKDIMRYSDFKRLLKIQGGIQEAKKPVIVTDTDDMDPNDQDDELQGVKQPTAVELAAKELEYQGPASSKVGHTMGNDDEAVRRMKVRYRTEDVDKDGELVEDLASADYKISPTTGRKYRAHRINFKNSGAKGRLNSGIEDDENNDDESRPLMKSEEIQNSKYTINEEETPLDNITDDDLDKMADSVEDVEDVIDAYDEDELMIVDDESGDEIEVKEPVEEEALTEVLSRMERMRAKARFARTSAKRERKVKIALKMRSSTQTLSKRARRLAVKLLKQKIARKPLDKLSVPEKERIEGILQRRKQLINRLAMKLVSRVRKIENTRLSHKKTK